MKQDISLPRRPLAPRHRVELRGPRRGRVRPRIDVLAPCGYLRFVRLP